VHSMDASHMCLVINHLKDIGISSFGAIHDSFSVHADDVDKLLETTKEVFIDMYDCNIIKDMKEQFVDNDEEFKIQMPESGLLDLNEIRISKYFFC